MPVDVLKEVPIINHPFPQDFEKSFDYSIYQKWVANNWTWTLYLSAIYVAVIFSIKRYMKNKEAFQLNFALGVWNAVLAIFSILGSIRTLYDLLYTIGQYGLQFSVCNPMYHTGVTGFWALLYIASKVPEFGDTIFIVLRKKKLIFLHWFHHFLTLINMTYSYKDSLALMRWGACINYTIHAFMYSYYAFSAFNVRFPQSVSKAITSMQLTQMVIMVGLNVWVAILTLYQVPCQQTWSSNILSFVQYSIYLILFGNFFIQRYLKQKKN